MSKVYEYVQDRIIRALEEAIENGGPAPWRKPWKGGIPKNYITKIPYQGINLLLLEGGSYLTFKQIQELQRKNPEVKLKKAASLIKYIFGSLLKEERTKKVKRSSELYLQVL